MTKKLGRMCSTLHVNRKEVEKTNVKLGQRCLCQCEKSIQCWPIVADVGPTLIQHMIDDFLVSVHVVKLNYAGTSIMAQSRKQCIYCLRR